MKLRIARACPLLERARTLVKGAFLDRHTSNICINRSAEQRRFARRRPIMQVVRCHDRAFGGDIHLAACSPTQSFDERALSAANRGAKMPRQPRHRGVSSIEPSLGQYERDGDAQSRLR